MAKAIRRVGGWFWWLAGLCCALVFGRSAGAQEGRAEPEYGVRVRPPAGQPAVPEEQKKRAEKLVDEYLAAELSPPEPTAEQKAKIDGLIKDLGSIEFAKRDAASAELIKIGRPALGALRKAAESKDPEVSWRAKGTIEKIGAGPEVQGLRSLGWPAQMAVRERTERERKAVAARTAEADAAEKSGKADEAGRLRGESKTAQARVDALVRLAGLLLAGGGPHMKEMIAPQPCEMVAPPLPQK